MADINKSRYKRQQIGVRAQTSGAEFLDEQRLEVARMDRDEHDRSETAEVVLRALEGALGALGWSRDGMMLIPDWF
jgi:hypothetical protein